MQLIINETENRNNFEPFANLHLVCELRCGALRLFEKIEHYFYDWDIVYYCDDDLLLDSFIKRESKNKNIKCNIPTLILNSNVLIDDASYLSIKKNIDNSLSNTIIYDNKKNIIGYYFKNFQLSDLKNTDGNYKQAIIKNVCVLNYIWDMFNIIGENIEKDWTNCINKYNFKEYEKNVFISSTARINKGVHFDTSKGTIIIDSSSVIYPLCFIEGPCYIGPNTIIKASTQIYENCSFGPYCKISGELENTIFYGYSNKQHNGYIGHSFISEWVNLGAGTTSSDLKNNYSNIIMQLSNKKIETGKRFIGSLIGDHSKTAINTSLNTGTVIGIFSNIAKSDLTEKYVPPFSWLTGKCVEKYNLQKAILTARVVMNRRNKELTFEEQELITACFMK